MHAILWRFSLCAAQAAAECEFGMVREAAPGRRRRMSGLGLILRRRRIFARLREGLTYEEIAGEEGVTSERIRQIVSDALQKRAVDSGADHAKLQLDRLAPLMQLAAEAVAAGDVSAIAPYLKVLDRLDRYQTVAGANQKYDAEARKKLFDKLNRAAANLGLDDAPAERARRMEILRQAGYPGEPDAADANAAADAHEGANAPHSREEEKI
jgi:DNA-binding CsgD family transcriptional regulator